MEASRALGTALVCLSPNGIAESEFAQTSYERRRNASRGLMWATKLGSTKKHMDFSNFTWSYLCEACEKIVYQISRKEVIKYSFGHYRFTHF